MRILFTRFPLESTLGGAEIQTLSLMEGLRKNGHEVRFLGSCPVLLEECAKRRIPSAKLQIGEPPVTKGGSISFLWRKKRMRENLIAALEQLGDIDAMFMLSLSEKLLITDWATTKGIHVFWIEHDRVGRWLTRNPWLPRLRRLSRQATTIVVSELSKKMYLGLGWKEENMVVIPNGVDVGRMTKDEGRRTKESIKLQVASSKPPMRLGCIARLSREKGVDLLVKAVQEIPNVTLSIIGKGPEEAKIRGLIKINEKRKRKNDVKSRGDHVALLEQTNKRTNVYSKTLNLSDFYNTIDILILPSRDHDPFGMVAAEAMMLGIPVVVTDACGIGGYLRDGEDAVIVKAGSETSLAEGITRLLDPQNRQRIGEEGKKTAEKLFSVEKMVQSYENCIEETRNK